MKLYGVNRIIIFEQVYIEIQVLKITTSYSTRVVLNRHDILAIHTKTSVKNQRIR